ncbi:MAG: hypothetical protein WD960_09310 [Gemmatimonadota bacterium]
MAWVCVRMDGRVRGELLGPIEGNDRNDPEARSPSRQLVDLRAGINEGDSWAVPLQGPAPG